tara:strand:- start:1153 stop:1749 length:597 start_codon:yes stop_codon:yes gene_type:complete
MLIMETIFTLGDIDEENQRVNLDDLYEKKKQQDLNTLSVYNKILNRIHNKIKTIARQHAAHQYCWYLVPEMMIGVPKYDHGACIAFCIDKLRENGFMIRYTHPNLLLISWQHWIPTYVRNEIKKKTGVNLDGYGNKIIKNNTEEKQEEEDPNKLMFQKNKVSIAPKNDFKSIDSYKPTGNLIYNKELLKNIEKKTKFS